MLKGVSQRVIEVVRTDNKYFEKAILFLRPAAQEEDRALLGAQAGEYLSKLDYRPHKSKRGAWVAEGLRFLLAALAGAAIACGFFLL